MRLAPCRCGHPGLGCYCFEARRAEAERIEREKLREIDRIECEHCRETALAHFHGRHGA